MVLAFLPNSNTDLITTLLTYAGFPFLFFNLLQITGATTDEFKCLDFGLSTGFPPGTSLGLVTHLMRRSDQDFPSGCPAGTFWSGNHFSNQQNER
jgi:hypothetical protein